MSDADRFDRVALALVDAIKKRVALPVIQPRDAAGITNIMYAKLDEAIAKRNAMIGARLACHEGCNACCAAPVLVTEGEGVAVAEWLREHPEARAQFERAYVAWRDTIGDLAGGGETADPDAHRAWMSAVLDRHAMCAFNHDGACIVYPVRPAICRKVHAIDTNENCASEDKAAAQYAHPETEQLYDAQRPMRFALHKALRPHHRLDLLCTTVARLLGL